MSGWPAALAGLRIGFLTDLHRSETVPHELIAHAVALLMAERPDLIVLGGDYVTWGDRHFVEPAADALAALSAPQASSRSSATTTTTTTCRRRWRRSGFTVLRDARTQIPVRGETARPGRHPLLDAPRRDISRLMRGASPNTILLAHTPTRLVEAAALAVPLVLSGHTHGGQIVLPGLGAIAARKFPVVAGTGKRENTAIFVSRGVGTVYVAYSPELPARSGDAHAQPAQVAPNVEFVLGMRLDTMRCSSCILSNQNYII